MHRVGSRQLDRVVLITTVVYCAAFVALGLSHASLGPTLMGLAAQVGTGLVQISYGLGARSAGYLAGSILAGRLYDAVRGHPVLALMLTCIGAGLAMLPEVSVLALLIVLLFVIGVAEGALDVGVNTLIVWVHGHKVGPYMNALHFFFGLGAFLSPIIIAQALPLESGIRLAYWVLAALMLPVAVSVVLVPSPVAGSTRLAAEGRAQSPGHSNDRLLLLLLPLFFFLYVGVEGSFGSWIATYARATGVGDEVTAAYLTSVFWGALTLGRLLSIPLALRFTPRRVLAFDLGICAVSVLVLLLWPGVPLATWGGHVRRRAEHGLGVSNDVVPGGASPDDYGIDHEPVLHRGESRRYGTAVGYRPALRARWPWCHNRGDRGGAGVVHRGLCRSRPSDATDGTEVERTSVSRSTVPRSA